MTAPASQTVAALLEAAASRIEELAGAATREGWHLQPDDLIGGWCVTVEDQLPSTGARQIADFVRREDAEWISVMKPELARPLVAWLRDEARVALAVVEEYAGGWVSDKAQEFARAVLGEAAGSPQEPPRAPQAALGGPGVPQGGSGDSEPSDAAVGGVTS